MPTLLYHKSWRKRELGPTNCSQLLQMSIPRLSDHLEPFRFAQEPFRFAHTVLGAD